MNWLIARLKEPSTWRGIILLLTVCGLKLQPDQQEAIIAAGLAVVGLIGVFTKDEPKHVNIQLPPIELQSKPESDDDDIFRGVHSYSDLVEKGRPKPFHELHIKSESVNQDDGYISRDTLRRGLRVDVPPDHITGTVYDERRETGFGDK